MKNENQSSSKISAVNSIIPLHSGIGKVTSSPTSTHTDNNITIEFYILNPAITSHKLMMAEAEVVSKKFSVLFDIGYILI